MIKIFSGKGDAPGRTTDALGQVGKERGARERELVDQRRKSYKARVGVYRLEICTLMTTAFSSCPLMATVFSNPLQRLP
tara:strand:+ start:408 stop:644 length:237 start_codon:yes stop_codon:yes gene_type:complete